MTDICKKLDAQIPEDAVETREQAGRKLSYLSGAYVIRRLNEVLGQGNWAYTSEVNLVHTGQIESRSGTTNSVHYIARVRLVVTVDEKSTEFTDYGYGDGTDKNNPGKAHELAVKESITDGLKRCAKNLGISMGLGLYFKDGQYVGQEETVSTPVPKQSANNTNAAVRKENTKETPKTVSSASNTGGERKTNPVAKASIKSAFAVLEAQKKTTAKDFREKFLSNKKVDELTDDQAQQAWMKITTEYKELTTKA